MAGPNLHQFRNQFTWGDTLNNAVQSHVGRQSQIEENALDRAIKNEYLDIEKQRIQKAEDISTARDNTNKAMLQSILGQKSAEYDYNQSQDQMQEDYQQRWEDRSWWDKWMGKKDLTLDKSPDEMELMDYEKLGLLPDAPEKGDMAKKFLEIMNQNPNAQYNLLDMLQFSQLLGPSSGTDNDAINSLLQNSPFTIDNSQITE
jgi:hypothetical protein